MKTFLNKTAKWFKQHFGQNTREQRVILLRTQQKLVELHITAALEFISTCKDFDTGLRRYISQFDMDSTTATVVAQLTAFRYFCGEGEDVNVGDVANVAHDNTDQVAEVAKVLCQEGKTAPNPATIPTPRFAS